MEDSRMVRLGRTDETGQYRFSIEPGQYELRFTTPGFAPSLLPVTIEAGKYSHAVDVVRQYRSHFIEDIAISGVPFLTPTPLYAPLRSAPLDTTLCRLMRNPERFNGNLVRFRATIDATRDALTLQDETCGKTLLWISASEDQPPTAREFADIDERTDFRNPDRMDWIPLPPYRPIVLEKNQAYHDLAKYLAKTAKPQKIWGYCPSYSVTVTVVGRFDYSSGKLIALRDSSGKIQAGIIRYGTNGRWNAQLVLQSVSHVTAVPINPSVYDRPAEITIIE
jgi:hypothetical protein